MILGFNIYISRRRLSIRFAITICVISGSGPRSHPGIIAHPGIDFIHYHQGIDDPGYGCIRSTAGSNTQHQYFFCSQGADHNTLAPLLAVRGCYAGFADGGQSMGSHIRIITGAGIDLIS